MLMERLLNMATYHAYTMDDPFLQPDKTIPIEQFTFDRYSSRQFQGFIPDTGAAILSTVGERQALALKRLLPDLQISRTTEDSNNIKFGDKSSRVTGSVNVETPVGTIKFHIINIDTPFLISLADMDRLKLHYNNLENVLIQGNNRIPVIRKWGHPFLMLSPEEGMIDCHLTEQELRQIHRRLGHPSVPRLAKVLELSGNDVEVDVLKEIAKFCHQCQMNSKAPGRYKITLKDDHEFNYSIIIDVVYLDGRPVLHVVDSATSFNAARWLKDMSAKEAWNALRACWIDVYLGPPDVIIHDPGTHFAAEEFREAAKLMSCIIKEMPTEAHNSVGKTERFHAPLRRAYEIISDELKGQGISKEVILQMAVKCVNDTANPGGIVPTLLVFGAYSRISDDSPPSPSMIQRAKATKKAMDELRKLQAERKVKDALNTRNGPSSAATLNLAIQSEVRVWREKKEGKRARWTGPYTLLAVEGETCTVQVNDKAVNFRATVVKPYHRPADLEGIQEDQDQSQHQHPQDEKAPESLRRGQRDRRSPQRYHAEFDDFLTSTAICELEQYFTHKEKADWALAIKLRKEGVITTPGEPFEESQRKEIEGLMAKGVFDFVQYDELVHGDQRIFGSRLVNEIKGKDETPFEKSRLVIQAFADDGKKWILTQNPTIQRSSQRLITSLAPSLILRGFSLYLRDIKQAYTQSTALLNRLILAKLPKEMIPWFDEGVIMVVRRALYGIPEAGTFWWSTYYTHHKEKLALVTSTYDPCLLVSSQKGEFGLVGMQTDDIYFLADEHFAEKEDGELKKAKFEAKDAVKLTVNNSMNFNGSMIRLEDDDTMYLWQKGQGKKLKLVTYGTNERVEYLQQRALGAYIASTCQPEASFELSRAAQHKDPGENEVNDLNKCIQWMMDNQDRGLRHIPLDLQVMKLFVFVDGSFANNKDFSSQIGYTIILANEIMQENDNFEITGNMIHWSSTKSKRITRSVLASEILGMVAGVDIAFAINTTLNQITKQLDLPTVPIVVCTDSYSLYECLVKLGTTKEKRLMIDVMALRQSYERREIDEIRWIDGKDNIADAMTKSNPNKALESFVNNNRLRIRLEGWVERREMGG